MPGTVKFTGLEKLRRDARRFESEIASKALRAAENAAAREIKQSIEAAAPVDQNPENPRRGWLKRNVTISRQRAKDAGLTKAEGLTKAGRVLVGVAREAFYGWFFEHGWTPARKAEMVTMRKGRRVYQERTRRLARGRMASGAHSQHGVSRGGAVPGTNWFSGAVDRILSQATSAAEKAFHRALRKIR